ncbi:basic helix-loop-helix (bHLH) DNA-binding superfamily protein [Wolffia australiana]
MEVGNREEDPIKEDRRIRLRTPPRQRSSRWKTAGEQLSYSAKLLEALRRVATRSAGGSLRSRAVREAADRVLAAAAARGRMRWSAAVLSTSRLRRRRRRRRPPLLSPRLSAKASSSSAMDGKMKTLARLVPGGRKLSFSSLLEEASDYISALEMQVRAMNTLAEALSCPRPSL